MLILHTRTIYVLFRIYNVDEVFKVCIAISVLITVLFLLQSTNNVTVK